MQQGELLQAVDCILRETDTAAGEMIRAEIMVAVCEKLGIDMRQLRGKQCLTDKDFARLKKELSKEEMIELQKWMDKQFTSEVYKDIRSTFETFFGSLGI